MMHWSSFTRSALFAAVAAAAWLPWVVVVAPIAGRWNALALYLAGATVAYVAGIVRPLSRGATIAVLAAIGSGAAVVASHSAVELCLGLGAVLGLARSAFLYRAAPARAVVVEAALTGGGLLLARFVAGPSPLGVGLAIWGFFLVQSVFFLIGGRRLARSGARHGDPFEDAHRRATVLLERTGV